jgi:MYXO-CTERM domain-containing protein
MMHKSLVTTIAALATAILFSVSTANATVYKFTFESSDAELTATGEFAVSTAGQVTGVSGVISGLTNQTISAVIPNPNFSSPAYSPDGSFIYNNVYHPTGIAFDIDGLLFVTAQNPAGYWNLWGNSPGNYSLWESAGSYNYPIEESGNLSVTAAPELSTWAMLALGFAALGVVGRRRRAPRLAPTFG